MVMGSHIKPYAYQKTSSMIAHLYYKMNYFLINYVDDYVGAEYEHRAHQLHTALIRLVRDIGAS